MNGNSAGHAKKLWENFWGPFFNVFHCSNHDPNLGFPSKTLILALWKFQNLVVCNCISVWQASSHISCWKFCYPLSNYGPYHLSLGLSWPWSPHASCLLLAHTMQKATVSLTRATLLWCSLSSHQQGLSQRCSGLNPPHIIRLHLHCPTCQTLRHC